MISLSTQMHLRNTLRRSVGIPNAANILDKGLNRRLIEHFASSQTRQNDGPSMGRITDESWSGDSPTLLYISYKEPKFGLWPSRMDIVRLGIGEVEGSRFSNI
jgi:hypothetical protein